MFLLLLAVSVAAQDVETETSLSAVYSECVLGLDWVCFQRHSLAFVDQLARAQSHQLMPGLLLVRTAPSGPPLEAEELGRMDGERLSEMMDSAVGQFFEEHVIRVQLPSWFRNEGRAMGHVDFFLGDGDGLEVSGRGKKKKKKKALKKILLLLLAVLIKKKLLLIPLKLGLIKLMAVKGLIFGLISLAISLAMIIKKKKMMMMMGGGGGGGGWMPSGSDSSGGGWMPSGGGGSGGGGGGGGWDRSLPAHELAYRSYDPRSNAAL